MTNAGVIFKVQFNQPGTWNSKYYEYVDDDKKSLKEAKQIENSLDYFDYLDGNFEKHKVRNYQTEDSKELDDSSLSFSRKSNDFTQNDKIDMTNKYAKACENNSNLWKGVISFDHEFLKEYKMLSEEDKVLYVNDKLLKEYAKQSIESFIKESGLVGADYHAGIHYNTDNIHIHFAVFEEYGTTTKGVVKQDVLDSVKSKMVNNISKDINFYKTVDSLKRDIKLELSSQFGSYDYKIKNLSKLLPKEGRISYGTLDSDSKLKVEVDGLIKEMLKGSPTFELYKTELEKGVTKYGSTYGGDKFEQYKENKLSSLHSELGNMIIKDIKSVGISNDKRKFTNTNKVHNIVKFSNTTQLMGDLKRISKSIEKKKRFDMKQAEEDEYSA